MRPTLFDYWDRQLDALKRRSVEAGPQAKSDTMVFPYDAESPYAGIIDARAYFDNDAWLDVYEHVKINWRGAAKRLQYSYHLQDAGGLIQRYDYDPDLPAEFRYHVNTPSGEHIPSSRVTLATLAEMCWTILDTHRYTDTDDS